MEKNKYFETILAKLGFLARHFRLIVFIFFIVFLFYIFTLSIRISSAIGHVPTSEEINKKIPAVQIRKTLINRLKQLIYVRQGNRYIQPDHNPFLPYQPSSDSVVTPSDIPTPTPSDNSDVTPDSSTNNAVSGIQP